MNSKQTETLDRRIAELQLDGYAQYASSSKDANLYYLTSFLAEDPFLFLRKNGQSILVTSGMEKARALKTSGVDRVVAREDFMKESFETAVDHATPNMIASVLREYEIKRLGVNADFPLSLADELRRTGYEIIPLSGSIEYSRSIKTNGELKHMARVQRSSEKALTAAITILAHSRISGDALRHKGQVLTSEQLKSAIGQSLINDACAPQNIIASSGKDSALPHLTGSGPIKADSSIVFDVFPQSTTSRYYADMSRTVLRGAAPPELLDMYSAVKEAQSIALKMLRPGISGAEVHLAVVDYFEENGFRTDIDHGRGFIHSTGHGLGLEVHELPFLNKRGGLLEKGNVVTVEPGLYYPNVGGVRLEDVAVITHNGNKNITQFPKEFVI
ncbi:MAG: M24 family metallopeptidase [Halobacteriota archaeon]